MLQLGQALFFDSVRSGYINTIEETGRYILRIANEYGYVWSSSAIERSESNTAYYLKFYASDTSPSRGPDNRRYGLSLRCLSTTAVGSEDVNS